MFSSKNESKKMFWAWRVFDRCTQQLSSQSSLCWGLCQSPCKAAEVSHQQSPTLPTLYVTGCQNIGAWKSACKLQDYTRPVSSAHPLGALMSTNWQALGQGQPAVLAQRCKNTTHCQPGGEAKLVRVPAALPHDAGWASPSNSTFLRRSSSAPAACTTTGYLGRCRHTCPSCSRFGPNSGT